ncbi:MULTISPECIES: DEAD/DEAH box helicase [unclassified Nocardioides]|uniref:DEAD/DEAH box helicase n=1 Tax=unclassified Nocardioides TaxID=2615069 RepID=UPI0000571D86|nr:MULTISPECIES: DEAD/DEAH box helicase [unclassified Nocardioides]ABL79358.1 DEAD/DEAH box helicase domain protein [Nocardioides sp. JS614]
MDVFKVHEQVIADYRAFTSGFVEVRDSRIKKYVDDQFEQGVQWPDPWLSLNPSFASGGAVPYLVAKGLLHPEAARIFRRKENLQDAGRDPIVLHQHQREAVEVARTGKSYVLTTGTGSGKSLAYIVPVVDAVLRDRDARGGERRPGVKAIVVYPMNALANSQVNELRKFLSFGYPEGGEPVTFARYTGQESQDERIRILAEPPDILLTNYVMLELVLTRPDERKRLVRAAQGLRFLALDELHTYRGRQGADVAMLIRRLRDQCASDDLQIVGTSATMASGGTQAERSEVVARVATRLFGAEVTPDRVIGETLVRATPDVTASDPELANAVTDNATQQARSFADFTADPLASWVETTFGLMLEEGTDRLVRRTPTTIPEAAEQLASRTGRPVESCAVALRNVLREGSSVRQPDTGRPVFAFRLHQFLSKGDTVYVSLEPEDTRHITGTYQVSVPDHPQKALLPLGFCRECGQEYLVVAKVGRDGGSAFVSRRDVDASGGDSVTGYLYVSSDLPWPEDPLAAGRLPESWLVTDPNTDRVEILDSKRKYLPTKVFVSPTGSIDETRAGLPAWFVSTPFAFCMRCGVSYEQVRGNDFGKLATLDAEGRSSAMTLLSASIVRSLRGVPETELPPSARKLLTFVDNRQDASLQAGHFNDFVQVAQLRAALYAALQAAGADGLTHEALADAVTDALGLTMRDFAQSPDAKFGARKDAERALRSVVEYQLYVDLQRGWRVTMPNLEQTGLVKVAYRDLPELAADEDSWAGTYLLNKISAAQREELGRILLDELRRVRAIEVDCLTEEGFDRLRRLARSHLIEPWTLGEDERVVEAGVAIPRPARAGGRRALLAVSGRGAFGKYLRRDAAGLPGEVRTEDSERVIQDLFRVLTDAGLLSRTESADGPEYRINAGALRWVPGDGATGASDPLRKAFSGEETARVNPFFCELYRDLARGYAGMLAREHTAQVPQSDRLEREEDFRTGDLPLLYCSPTMELGVDISDLNAVGLRNVPPTPANYAQRSGRAGRNGQQALVLTYCSTGNAHDNYWFRRSREMVSGSVIAPRLDLTNEDLIRSHVHAIWLAETDESMKSSITDLVEAGGDTPSLTLLPQLWDAVNKPNVTRHAQQTAERVLAELRHTWALDGGDPSWWSDTWVHDQVKHAAASLDDALQRWRELYRTALAEYHEQHRLAISTNASKWDRRQAERRRADARNQLTLLRNDDREAGATDFYSYRYLASEGFLPGYSFPRLPLAAYIPARRGRKVDGDFLQRPRFVAISEFGPNSLIYHEGARYEVTRVQMPRDPGNTTGGGAVTETAKRCEGCGYHHPVRVGLDRCENCQHPLGATQYGLLRLQTVFTRRRERISSDEEERRKSGFELEVSLRFADRGGRPNCTRATASAGNDPVLEMSHAEAAEIRIANVGRRRRKNPQDRGFWLDLREGNWLSDKQAADSPVDTEGLVSAEDVKEKEKVTPYVEDRRNLLVLRLTRSVEDQVAVTLRAALERAIEAEFQLEDSELDSRELPDLDGRGRMLLTEAAEGGAGVLGRLVDEPDALARVARRALTIVHYNPDTGDDLEKAPGARERCERGCYDCLLSYANQYEHSRIDRHAVVPLLRQLLKVQVAGGAGGRDRDDQRDWLHKLRDSELERKFVDWLSDTGRRLPDDAQRTIEAAQARPDFVYDLPGNPVAVFVDGPHHDDAVRQQRDEQAAERLENLGWTVVRIRHDDDWTTTADRYQWLFGPARSTAST